MAIFLSLPVIVLGILLYAKFSTEKVSSGQGIPSIGRYGMIGDFSLTDHRGDPFTKKETEGKIWVANFIFTSCATECPVLSRRMREIQKVFEFEDQVQLVSISVDPRTDSPERLSSYAESFDAGEKWFFLTGDEKVIEHLSVKGFKVAAPGSSPAASSVRRTRQLLHSEKIMVVDQLGVVRFYANGMNPRCSKWIADAVRKLLATNAAE